MNASSPTLHLPNDLLPQTSGSEVYLINYHSHKESLKSHISLSYHLICFLKQGRKVVYD